MKVRIYVSLVALALGIKKRLLKECKLSQFDIEFACRFERTYPPFSMFGTKTLTVQEAHP